LFAKGLNGNLTPRDRRTTCHAKTHCQSAALAERADRPRHRRPDRAGQIQLLENIQACGSISAAGRAMDMSYKRAWDLVDEINRICKRAAVERQTGARTAAVPT